MLNPQESNVCDSTKEDLTENPIVFPQPNEDTDTINPSDQSNPMELKEDLNQGNSNNQNVKKDGIGKWVDSDKGRRSLSEPYPSVSHLKKSSPQEMNLFSNLMGLFTSAKCNLCNCEMTSPIIAQNHYCGRKHVLKTTRWLSEYSYVLDEISSGNLKLPMKEIDLTKMYCKYCNLMLSSEQQAEAHYNGRKHKNVIKSGIPKNAYYNPITGKWEKRSNNSPSNSANSASGMVSEKNALENKISKIKKLFCGTCNVTCSSQITFDAHLAGTRHKKKMVLLRNAQSADELIKDVNMYTGSDLTVYRTPTSEYYCQGCNITSNSSTQFIQHLEGKKHIIKIEKLAAKR